MMERVDRAFLSLLRAGVRGGVSADVGALTEEEQRALFHLAAQHKLLPLIYEAAYRLPEMRTAPVMAELKLGVMQQVMVQAQKTGEFLALSRELEAAGVRALVVKGVVCRALYEMPDHRPSGDEDILVAEDAYDACCAVLSRRGMTADVAQDPQGYEVSYREAGSALHIELHRSLFPPESAAYGDMNRLFDGVFDRAVKLGVPGGEVFTLAPTEHLLYLICHAFKHFLHGGFGVRQVCDIVLFAEKYGGQIDWVRLQESCRSFRAEKFAAVLFEIGRNYLDFEPAAAGVPAAFCSETPDEGPMLLDLLRAGVYGSADMRRKHSSSITLHAVAEQKLGRRSGSGVLRTLFPRAKDIQGRYPYLKKYPVLLPAAWFSRIVTYGRETAGSHDPAAAARIGAQRVELLRYYGIVDS